MALQWTSAIRDIVCYQTLGKAYSALRADEKLILDDNNSSAVPTSTPAGVAGQAMTVVGQWAQYFAEAGSAAAGIPSAWDHVLTAEVNYRLAIAMRRDDIKIHAANLKKAWSDARDTFTVSDPSSATFTAGSITAKKIRFFVIRNALAGQRVMIKSADIDQAIIWAIAHLWNRTSWEFRKRQVTMTISTTDSGSAPTFEDAAGNAITNFDSVASRDFKYSASTVTGLVDNQVLRWAESTDMAGLKAANASTGRPSFFNVEDQGNGVRYWHFVPVPDDDYEAYGAIYLAHPAAPSDGDDTTPFTKFPKEHQALFPNLVYAKVAKDYGIPNATQIWDRAMDEVELACPIYDDPGDAAKANLAGVNVYEDDRKGRWGGEGL